MDEHRGSPRPSDGHHTGPRIVPKGRLEAFSDGVFAIAVTLLVLELKVPEAGADLWAELLREWPAFLGYVVSFAFIGGCWIAHSTLTRFISQADGVLLGLNLVLLLAVSLLPFSTSLMATHLDDPGERVAVVLFGLDLLVAAVLVNAVLAYAAGTPGIPADDVAEDELRAFGRERRVAIAVQAAATVLAVFLPVVAVLVYLAVAVLLLLDPLWRARRRRVGAARGSGTRGSAGRHGDRGGDGTKDPRAGEPGPPTVDR